MEKPAVGVGNYFNLLRFVFLTSFVLCCSLLLLDYNHLVLTSDGRRGNGITFLLLDLASTTSTSTSTSHHAHMPKFSPNFTEPVIKTSNNSSTIPRNIGIQNHNLDADADPCSGQYIYVYDLPSRFNQDLLKHCHSLFKWADMCPYMSNLGLGPKVVDVVTHKKSSHQVSKDHAWYATNQFSLEVIFHNTMRQYKCLTNDSSLASAIYVPYYAGLDVGQYLWGDHNVSVRDASPKQLVNWLSQRHEWKTMWGRDHFMVGGRIGLDFRRATENDSDWGTKLMFLPIASNMSLLTIESSSYDNDFAIPYPTYFHPSKDTQVFKWQERMRRVKRPYLFSFAGAPRPNSSRSIRSELIQHCQSSSTSCKLLGCSYWKNDCDDPVMVMKVFQSSVFCLQPPGDSFTRRSTFDSILAGCIPVFFHPHSAYTQYLWHLPRNGSRYSLFIPEQDVREKKVRINETLARVAESEQVLALREEVISLIPRIIYRHPNSTLKSVEDAFDTAVKGILARIQTIREDISDVKDSSGGRGGIVNRHIKALETRMVTGE